MKVALVHDSLVEFGGAERVLQVLLKIFPDADIYSSYAKSIILQNFFNISRTRLHLSFLQKTPLVGHNTLLQVLSPIIWRCFNLEKYDLVISISSFALCNIININTKKAIHVQYILGPPKNLFNISPRRPLQKIIPYTKIVSGFYHKALYSSPYIITDSLHIQNTIYNLFGLNSKVIYPPVRVPKSLPKKKKARYFIIVSRLEDTKGIDLAIDAFNHLKLPLKIIGQAANLKYERYLKSISGSTIEFLGEKSDKEIDKLYKSAIAFIFTAKNEDFGIAPVEAMARGVPVIAFYGGGLKETVIKNKNGLFFYEHKKEALIDAIKTFASLSFNDKDVYESSFKYSDEHFCFNINKYLESII